MAFFTFKIHTASRNTPKCNFTYLHKNSTAHPAPIFTKLTKAQQHAVCIDTSISLVPSCTQWSVLTDIHLRL